MKHHGTVLNHSKGYNVILCEECGFRHLDPLPDPEELERIYRESYYENEKPDYISAKERDLQWWEMWWEDHLDFLEKRTKGRWFLDFGCGPGHFLQYATGRGWAGIGVDKSEKALKYALSMGLDVCSLVEPFEPPKQCAICAFEVLEHLSDPLEFLEQCARGLMDDGILVLTVPNDYNPLQAIAQKVTGKTYWLAPPYHVNYFDPDTLGALLRKAGFYILDWTVTFPMEIFILMGMDYVSRPEIGPKCHEFRKTLEMNLPGDVRRKLYRQLRELHIGRELIVYAKKAGNPESIEDRLSQYAGEAWGPDRDEADQIARLCEEVGELARAIARNDKRDTRYQAADCLLLLADIAKLAGASASGLMDWKLTSKQVRRGI